MKWRRYSIFMISATALLSSCIKDELAVPARDPGDAEVVQVCMGPTYRSQIWFDIGTNTVVATNNKEDWDLAVGWNQNIPYITMNGARLMRAAVSTETLLENVNDTLSVAGQFRVDTSSGDLNGLAIDLAIVGQKVIILDMGYSHLGVHLGVQKIKIVQTDPQFITIMYAPIGSTAAGETMTIDRDPATNLAYGSFSTGQQLIIEPPIGTYDIVFTQYTFSFDDPVIDYIVTGVLIARSGVRAARIDDAQFENVMLSDTLLHPMSRALDVIGYDWKVYDFDLSVYTVDPAQVFILQDSQGLFYKIHFTDFYNDQGQKGCPKFEVVAF